MKWKLFLVAVAVLRVTGEFQCRRIDGPRGHLGHGLGITRAECGYHDVDYSDEENENDASVVGNVCPFLVSAVIDVPTTQIYKYNANHNLLQWKKTNTLMLGRTKYFYERNISTRDLLMAEIYF